MQAFAPQCVNVSDCPDSVFPQGLAHSEKYAAAFTSLSELEPIIPSRTWAIQLTAVLLISAVWLSTQIQTRRASKSLSALPESKDPPQVPYYVPVLGHVFSYLLDPFSLASFIRYDIQAHLFLSRHIRAETNQ